jgi:hypothetical protein
MCLIAGDAAPWRTARSKLLEELFPENMDGTNLRGLVAATFPLQEAPVWSVLSAV